MLLPVSKMKYQAFWAITMVLLYFPARNFSEDIEAQRIALAETYFEGAMEVMSSNGSAAAIHFLRAAVRLFPESTHYLNVLGQAELENGFSGNFKYFRLKLLTINLPFLV